MAKSKDTRRRLNPTTIHRLWSALIRSQLKTGENSVSLEKILEHFDVDADAGGSSVEDRAASLREIVVKAAEEKLVTVAPLDAQYNGGESVELGLPHELECKPKHDWYCFHCHQIDSPFQQNDDDDDEEDEENRDELHKCQQCWRVFHSRCSQRQYTFVVRLEIDKRTSASTSASDDSVDLDRTDKICLLCQLKQEHARPFHINGQEYSAEEFNEILSYTFCPFIEDRPKKKNRLIYSIIEDMKNKIGEGEIMAPNDSVDDGCTKLALNHLVHQFIDIDAIQNKLEAREYSSIAQYFGDCLLLKHCFELVFLASNTGALKPSRRKDFKNDMQDIFDELRHDFKDIFSCINCYLLSNRDSDDDFWFSQTCDPPHLLVFAKQKGYSYWPAKVISPRIVEDPKTVKRFEVRFFGGNHERYVVDQANVKDIDSPLAELGINIKANSLIEKALHELRIHRDLLEEEKSKNGCLSEVASTNGSEALPAKRQRKSTYKLLGEAFETDFTPKNSKKKRKLEQSDTDNDSVMNEHQSETETDLKKSIPIEVETDQDVEVEIVTSVKQMKVRKKESKMTPIVENNKRRRKTPKKFDESDELDAETFSDADKQEEEAIDADDSAENGDDDPEEEEEQQEQTPDEEEDSEGEEEEQSSAEESEMSEDDYETPTSKRKRGRPRKSDSPAGQATKSPTTPHDANSVTGKRKRLETQRYSPVKSIDLSLPRKRGRPSKAYLQAIQHQQEKEEKELADMGIDVPRRSPTKEVLMRERLQIVQNRRQLCFPSVVPTVTAKKSAPKVSPSVTATPTYKEFRLSESFVFPEHMNGETSVASPSKGATAPLENGCASDEDDEYPLDDEQLQEEISDYLEFKESKEECQRLRKKWIEQQLRYQQRMSDLHRARRNLNPAFNGLARQRANTADAPLTNGFVVPDVPETYIEYSSDDIYVPNNKSKKLVNFYLHDAKMNPENGYAQGDTLAQLYLRKDQLTDEMLEEYEQDAPKKRGRPPKSGAQEPEEITKTKAVLEKSYLQETSCDRECLMKNIKSFKKYRLFLAMQNKETSEKMKTQIDELTEQIRQLQAEKEEMKSTLTRQVQVTQQYNPDILEIMKEKIAETKRHIWCSNCLTHLGEYLCCLNTNYCSIACQRAHWRVHGRICQQIIPHQSSAEESPQSKPLTTTIEVIDVDDDDDDDDNADNSPPLSPPSSKPRSPKKTTKPQQNKAKTSPPKKVKNVKAPKKVTKTATAATKIKKIKIKKNALGAKKKPKTKAPSAKIKSPKVKSAPSPKRRNSIVV